MKASDFILSKLNYSQEEKQEGFLYPEEVHTSTDELVKWLNEFAILQCEEQRKICNQEVVVDFIKVGEGQIEYYAIESTIVTAPLPHNLRFDLDNLG